MSDNLPSSYAEIGKLVSPGAYRQVLAYLSWHNRLPMTPMLTVWQALVLAFAGESRDLDPLFYSSIKSFFEGRRIPVPQTVDDCRRIGQDLTKSLSS